MADIQDALQKLFSDPESLKKVTDLAAGLASVPQAPISSPPAGEKNIPSGALTTESQPDTAPEEKPSGDLIALLTSLGKGLSPSLEGKEEDIAKEKRPDLSSFLSFFGKSSASPPKGEDEQANKEETALLPRLMMAFAENTSYLKPEKVNLLRALKPYLGERRAPDIDRAVKMANLARAAQKALSGMQRR